MPLRGIEKLKAETERLIRRRPFVTLSLVPGGPSVTITEGEHVEFCYKGKLYAATIVKLTPWGWRCRVDGSGWRSCRFDRIGSAESTQPERSCMTAQDASA